MNPPDLNELRQRLGGTVSRGGRTWQGPGPGHSRRDMSLKVDIQDDGRILVISFAQDPLAACEAHLGFRVGGGAARASAGLPPLPRHRQRTDRPAQDRTRAALRLWRQTFDR